MIAPRATLIKVLKILEQVQLGDIGISALTSAREAISVVGNTLPQDIAEEVPGARLIYDFPASTGPKSEAT